MKISKQFNNWTMADDDRFNIEYIDTKGRTLEELLDNAEISISDWHGNQARDNWTLGDLHEKDYKAIEEMFTQELARLQ